MVFELNRVNEVGLKDRVRVTLRVPIREGCEDWVGVG